MIHVYSLYDRKVETEITQMCKTIQISGELNQVARKLSLTLLYSIYDTNQPTSEIGCGNLVWVVDDDAGEIFRGVVFDREINGNNETTVTAQDYLIYMSKFKSSYNFSNISPEEITAKLCDDAGISAGNLAVTGITTDLVEQGKDLYSIIKDAYYQASLQNGKKYIILMNGEKLDVIEKGQLVSDVLLSTDTNIELATYTDTSTNMVNKVRVEDESGNPITYVSNDEWIYYYGLLQDSYTAESDKNYNDVAKNMLHGVDNYFTLTALGNIKCVTGYSVNVLIPWFYITEKSTVMYIDADSHTWDMANGKYEMELTLNFSNQMDKEE